MLHICLQCIFSLSICLSVCVGRFKIQRFNSVSSQTSGSLLMLSAISIIIPTAAQHLGTSSDEVTDMLGQGLPLNKASCLPVDRYSPDLHLDLLGCAAKACSLAVLLPGLA